MATASVPNTFVNETTADADEVNQNFASLVNFINQNVVHRDASKAMAGALDAGSNKVVNVTAPTVSTDAANKAYVDAVVLDTANITDGAVTTAKLATDAVNGSKLANDSVDSEHYVDGSIDAVHLASSSVPEAKIVDGAVTTNKIGSSAVTAGKIAASNVTLSKLAVQQFDDNGPTSDLTVTTSNQTLCSASITCAAGSVGIISASADLNCTVGSNDAYVVELVVDATVIAGAIVWRAQTSGDRATLSNTWVVTLGANPTIFTRIRKVGTGGSGYVQGAAVAADSHTRLNGFVFNA